MVLAKGACVLFVVALCSITPILASATGYSAELCAALYATSDCSGEMNEACQIFTDHSCYTAGPTMSVAVAINYESCNAVVPVGGNFAVLKIFGNGESCGYDNTAQATFEANTDGACHTFSVDNNTMSAKLYCPSSSSSSSKCFPASATVELEDGSHKTMAQLAIGDKVRVSATEFSPVYMFSHRLEAAKAAFVTVEASTVSLQLTPDHYLYVNGVLATALTVKVADEITLADGSKAAVTKVHTTWAQGLYNPHTMHGDIVVNGVQTSTYTQGIAPALAHAALWPVRAMYAAGVSFADETTFAAGSQLLADVLPNGKAKY